MNYLKFLQNGCFFESLIWGIEGIIQRAQLPDYVVYYSEFTVRLVMYIVGAVLVALVIVAFIMGLFKKRGFKPLSTKCLSS